MSDAALERVVVREADGEDAGRLALVSDATFLETFAGMISGDALVTHCQRRHAPDYLRQLLEGGARAWLAELDGAPIGYALLTAPELDAAREGDIELKKIYVLSRFHGSGLAARLLDAALAKAGIDVPADVLEKAAADQAARTQNAAGKEGARMVPAMPLRRGR